MASYHGENIATGAARGFAVNGDNPQSRYGRSLFVNMETCHQRNKKPPWAVVGWMGASMG
jgi:hypothetical protein